MSAQTIHQLFDIALWLAGAGHFILPIAGVQIPHRFHWKEDLAKLMPMNRKLLWTYGAFTMMTVVAFGALTLALHDELLRGDRAALGLALFIGLFWVARIIVDFAYHTHTDWPKGWQFVVGHILLTALFFTLGATYLGLFVWHVRLKE